MESCSICCELIRNPTCCIPCGHVFCSNCICKWKSQNPTCPNCRDNVETLQKIFYSSPESNIENCIDRNGYFIRLLNIGLKFARTRLHTMKDDIIIIFVIIAIPFIIVYCDAGVRYIGPPVSNTLRSKAETFVNMTVQCTEQYINTTHLISMFRDVSNCVTLFLDAELSVICTLFQVIGEIYALILRLATLLTSGIQKAVWKLYEVLKDITLLMIPDLLYSIKLLLSYPCYLIIDIIFGIWDTFKLLWDFIQSAWIPVGWLAFNILKVAIRLVIYFHVNRVLERLLA